jgi:hypothetical protein
MFVGQPLAAFTSAVDGNERSASSLIASHLGRSSRKALHRRVCAPTSGSGHYSCGQGINIKIVVL